MGNGMVRTVYFQPLVCAAAVVLAAFPVDGAGFGVFQQGAKAMGMAGAFTAQADDPSAMFHNAVSFERTGGPEREWETAW